MKSLLKNSLPFIILMGLSNEGISQSVFDKFEKWLGQKHFQITYGPQIAWYKNSHLTFVQEEYDRNIIFQDVKAKDDPSLDFLLKKGEFGVEQFRVAFGIELSKNYSVQIVATHLTYLVQVENDYYRNGLWNGQKESNTFYFRDDFAKLEHSNGINIWNIGVQRNIWLTRSDSSNFRVSIGIMPKIGAILTATQAEVRNPTGIFEHFDPGNNLAGFDYSLDFSLRFLFFQHFQLTGNLNYFQFLIDKAKLSNSSYVSQKLRGYNWGINMGWRF